MKELGDFEPVEDFVQGGSEDGGHGFIRAGFARGFAGRRGGRGRFFARVRFDGGGVLGNGWMIAQYAQAFGEGWRREHGVVEHPFEIGAVVLGHDEDFILVFHRVALNIVFQTHIFGIRRIWKEKKKARVGK